MKVYVVVKVYAGCVDGVEGFTDEGQARLCLVEQQRELGIEPEFESESEHDVKLFQLDIEVLPPSVQLHRTASY